MTQNEIAVEQATNCAACGGPLGEQRYGRYKDFCSPLCLASGRLDCKQCHRRLNRPTRTRKDFCDQVCRNRYYRLVRPSISPFLVEERKRSNCKKCGEPLPPSKNIRFYCSQRCGRSYRIALKKGQDPYEKWGMYAPLTRGMIREIEEFMGIGAAKRLASAIDREYVIRKRRESGRDGRCITYKCKTCDKDFRRRPWSLNSKEYCSLKCDLAAKDRGSMTSVKLTWEQVDEIRYLRATEHLSQRALGEKFGVERNEIGRIVRYEVWKPENDPRNKQQMTSSL